MLEAGPFAATCDAVHRELHTLLDQRITRAVESARSDPTVRGSRYAWTWATNAMTALEAYGATFDERFLALVAESFDVILSDRDDRHGRIDEWREQVLPGWSIRRNGMWSSTATIPGRITYPAAVFVRWVKIRELARYRATAERFLTAIEETVQAYMAAAAPDPAGGLHYMNPFDGEIDAFDHINALAATEAVLHGLTGNDRYREIAAGHAEFFHAHAERDTAGALQWIYRCDRPGKPPRPEPVWKAAETLMFALEARRAGFGFTDGDLDALARALLVNIIRPDGINRDVSSRPLKPLAAAPTSKRRRRIAMWAMLHEVDERVGQEIASIVETQADLVPEGWGGGDFELYAFAQLLDARPSEGASSFAERCVHAPIAR